jgi:hypothetical protein
MTAKLKQQPCLLTRNPYRKGIISTVDLLVLTSSEHLLSILKLYLSLFTNQPSLMRRSTVQSLLLLVRVP